MMNESEKKQEFNEKYSQFIEKIKEKGNELYRLETVDRNNLFFVGVHGSTNNLEVYIGIEKRKHDGGHLQETRLCEYVLGGIDKNKHDLLSYYRGVLKALGLSFPIQEHNGAPEHGGREKSAVDTFPPLVEEGYGDAKYELQLEKKPSFKPYKTDHVEKAENNKKTGDKGEKLAFAHERQRVSGKYKDKVKHYSADKGDGLGYDILSVTETGEEKYIEVKTTEGKFEAPFFVTATELAWCKKHPNQYYLYRVYNLNEESAKLRVIRGQELIRLCKRPANYNISLDKPPA